MKPYEFELDADCAQGRCSNPTTGCQKGKCWARLNPITQHADGTYTIVSNVVVVPAPPARVCRMLTVREIDELRFDVPCGRQWAPFLVEAALKHFCEVNNLTIATQGGEQPS